MLPYLYHRMNLCFLTGNGSKVDYERRQAGGHCLYPVKNGGKKKISVYFQVPVKYLDCKNIYHP